MNQTLQSQLKQAMAENEVTRLRLRVRIIFKKTIKKSKT